MPFSRDSRYQSERQAEREEDENASPSTPWNEDTTSPAAIVEHYKWLASKMREDRAFDLCATEFGYDCALKALATVSASAKRWLAFRGGR